MPDTTVCGSDAARTCVTCWEAVLIAVDPRENVWTQVPRFFFKSLAIRAFNCDAPLTLWTILSHWDSGIRGLTFRECREFCAEFVDPRKAHRVPGDVYGPCALGAILNDETIAELEIPIVSGAANNRLAQEHLGFSMRDRGILHAPNNAIDAGGVISMTRKDGGEAALLPGTSNIGATMSEIFF